MKSNFSAHILLGTVFQKVQDYPKINVDSEDATWGDR